MIKVEEIKPCGGVSTVVIVEEGSGNPVDGGEVTNDSVNLAIGENAEATRVALELGNAATKDVGTAAGTVAAGDHGHTPGEIGAATAAQGALAASAVQPNTPASFSSVHAGAAPVFLAPHLTFGTTDSGFTSIDGIRTDIIARGVQLASWHRDQAFFFYRTVVASKLGCNPFTPSPDPCLEQEATGLFAVSNGFGSYRDIKLRDLIATQYLRPASYTVAAANALVSPPDGAIIHVSNEAGGACNAYRARSAWRRIYDDAPIS